LLVEKGYSSIIIYLASYRRKYSKSSSNLEHANGAASLVLYTVWSIGFDKALV
jgi:hypothetical protein